MQMLQFFCQCHDMVENFLLSVLAAALAPPFSIDTALGPSCRLHRYLVPPSLYLYKRE